MQHACTKIRERTEQKTSSSAGDRQREKNHNREIKVSLKVKCIPWSVPISHITQETKLYNTNTWKIQDNKIWDYIR